MIGEIDVYGLFIPPLLILAVLAWGLSGLLRRGLRAVGFYGWVWHPPLFDLALYVVLLGALTALTGQLR
ncbi:DUF1656 domain-containing protein [Azospirillum rugosum]|uniref:DUF1656 domain-containing protein n=1 Tax=Azospirillum rugosum TaxID=416170 RepID=A0ABS4SPQ9_9PROT|nr:DUF1656 domain-containing protein [Azospirillum rugosum]MBP2294543.1 hypothetical protein [Azospirillum rugosum]MDQ0524669.1 hypothetical protein [Azospirillum rugosum]